MNPTLAFNSFAVAGGATLLALVAGTAVALCIAGAGRTANRAWLAVAAASLAVPPFLSANAWLDLTSTWRALSSPERVAVWSLPLTAVVLASLLWPLSALMLVGAWSRLQPGQLEADPQVRGGWLLRGLLLPLGKRELVGASAITFALALANFTVPTLFQVRVFTEEFWVRFNTQFDTAGALVATWPLLLVPLGLLSLPKGSEVRWPRDQAISTAALLRQQLGWVRRGALIVAFAWLALSLGIPLAQLVLTPRTWTELPGALAAGGSALFNSVWAAAACATLVTGLALLVAMNGWRLRSPGPAWLVFLLPGVFLGVALIWMLNRSWTHWIYQSPAIVLLAFGLRYFAPGWSGVARAVEAADADLVDAARCLGANSGRAFRDAVWPQIRGQVAAAWYVVYLLCLWDVETVVLIQPPGGETLALRIFNLLHYGHAAQVNALCVVMLGLALAPLLVWGIRVRGSGFGVRGSKRTPGVGAPLQRRLEAGHWGFSGALSLVLGAFLAGCSPHPSHDSGSLDSKLFASVQIIGTRGVAPGQFNKPRSLICDREDNLYVTDMTGRVQKFSSSGRFLLQWQMPQTDLGKPKGMGLDSDGNILVVEPHYQRINHFTPEGKLVAQWGIKGTNVGEFILPRSVAMNPRGEFFVSEYTLVDRVQRFAVGPASAASAASIEVMEGTAGGGRALVARPTASWGAPGLGPGEFNRAEGIGIDHSNRVYVADSCNHRIQVFDADGKFLRMHGRAGSNPGEFSYPYDIKLDVEGRQYVCEFGNCRITVLDDQDRVIEVLGRAGAEPGEFANPWSIALDSHGNLYVADSQNHRVQRFARRQTLAGDPACRAPRLATVQGSGFRVQDSP